MASKAPPHLTDTSFSRIEHTESLFEEEVAKISEVLKPFDPNSTGKIPISDLGTILRILGKNPGEQDIKDLNKIVDPESKNMFKIENLLYLLQSSKFQDDNSEMLTHALNEFDHDADGKLEIKELKEVLTTLGEVLSDEEFNFIVQKGDPSNTGKVVISLFVKSIYNNN